MNAGSLTELRCALGATQHFAATQTLRIRRIVATSSRSTSGHNASTSSGSADRSHSTGPQHAVSKSNNCGPFALTSQFAPCGLP
jgi:hypothetical protein